MDFSTIPNAKLRNLTFYFIKDIPLVYQEENFNWSTLIKNPFYCTGFRLTRDSGVIDEASVLTKCSLTDLTTFHEVFRSANTGIDMPSDYVYIFSQGESYFKLDPDFPYFNIGSALTNGVNPINFYLNVQGYEILPNLDFFDPKSQVNSVYKNLNLDVGNLGLLYKNETTKPQLIKNVHISLEVDATETLDYKITLHNDMFATNGNKGFLTTTISSTLYSKTINLNDYVLMPGNSLQIEINRSGAYFGLIYSSIVTYENIKNY